MGYSVPAAVAASLVHPDRPVIGAAERVRILSALDSVDYVVVFATDELDRVIEAVRPEVLTKGSNYENDTVAGRELVERLGGRVALVPVTEAVGRRASARSRVTAKANQAQRQARRERGGNRGP